MIKCLSEADQIIAKVLISAGIDYSAYRQLLAKLFDDVLYQGIWDAILEVEPPMRGLALYQEDEFDQHMSDEDKPDEKDYICYTSGHYIYFAA